MRILEKRNYIFFCHGNLVSVSCDSGVRFVINNRLDLNLYHEVHEEGDPARRRSSGRRAKKCNFSGSEIQKSDTTFTIQMGVICIVKVVSDLL